MPSTLGIKYKTAHTDCNKLPKDSSDCQAETMAHLNRILTPEWVQRSVPFPSPMDCCPRWLLTKDHISLGKKQSRLNFPPLQQWTIIYPMEGDINKDLLVLQLCYYCIGLAGRVRIGRPEPWQCLIGLCFPMPSI